MNQQVIPPRMYQGPRQEKHYRKKQRQLQQQELQNVYQLDKQETPIGQYRTGEPSQNVNATPNTLSVPAFDRRLLPAVIQPLAETQPQPKPAVRKRHFPLTILAYALALVGMAMNGWYAYCTGATVTDKIIFCGFGFISEATMFFLPSQATSLYRDRNVFGFMACCVVYVFVLAYALTNSLGFASLNLAETATARSERITPAVSDAQRKLDAITASKTSECIKRGDKCRQLEKDEQTALEGLREAREKVSATSDPQVVSASKLVTWLSLGRYKPTADDFAMFRLLLLTLLPQLGGLVLMLSQRS